MRTLHHVLDIEADPDTVWSSLTERDGLAGWWSTELEAAAPSVGSTIAFTFAGDFKAVMEITAIDPGRRVAWHCVSGHPNWQDNDFIFELVALEDGRCRLGFTQEYAVELSDDDYGVYNFNWGYYLESLRLLCATGPGKPFGPG